MAVADKQQDAPRQLPDGAIVRDTYTVDRFLGAGQFAEVYLVRHRYMGMQAMKVFKERHDDPGLSDRFAEAFLLSKVSHPNIVRAFDANVTDEQYGGQEYLTMEYLDESFDQYLARRSSPPSVEESLELICQAAAGLAHAHAHEPPIVHRDIKPQNMLVADHADHAQVKLGDFGLARPLEKLTGMTRAAGTLVYMAPEGFEGYYLSASDVFSLGLVLYETLCGCLPYSARSLSPATDYDDMWNTVAKAQSKSFRPPSYFNNTVRPDIDDVVMTALAKKVDDRFQTGGEMLGALATCRKSLLRERDAVHTPASTPKDDKRAAEKLVAEAMELAAHVETLPNAVSRLELAMAIDSAVEAQYRKHLDFWRRGITYHA